MIKLYQFASCWNLPNPSPFCMKLETYLRMTKLPFETVTVGDLRKAPKGKLPYINDNGYRIGDSSLIIQHLKQEYGDPLDANLTDADRAQALAIQRLLEEHLYWIIVYSRWIDAKNWPETKKAFFGKLPSFIYFILPGIIRKKILRDLHGHGIGRHTRDEIYQLGINDLKTITTILSDKPFILGSEPTSIDATVYAFLANILTTPESSPLQDYAKSKPNLVAYCQRMKDKFY